MKTKHFLEDYFLPVLSVDETDPTKGTVTVRELVFDADDACKLHSLVGHAATEDDTPLVVDLYDVAAGEVLAVDIMVTVRPAAERVRFKLSALVWGDGATATLEGTVDVDKKPSGSACEATISVAGGKVQLTLTGIAATDLSWGWEARAQRQVA